ncbi:choice-of-anchor Q domain-containing protein [Dyadobacter sp. CY323]|uniref:choice-of-anchor Q domain-containing protein n=1 Tax=Dyadobacter sp. CY323 TaxID=2907302 RepID=UPI001F2A773A|nr:choice-of-anchor Q domain-containing protein [Dyadobacter sp. CY323]MCE6991434.1 T9SS type A sorting domain-containing protein [Dyadobacter sp. CY323]
MKKRYISSLSRLSFMICLLAAVQPLLYGAVRQGDASKAQRSAERKSAAAAVPPILFVNGSRTEGSFDGSSWGNAFNSLAEALKYAHENSGVQQIWVANGVYRPGYDFDYINEEGEDPNDYTFRLVPDVKLFGGFKGVENSLAERKLTTVYSKEFKTPEEDENRFTILEGDNLRYHVVTSAGEVGGASLDGFMITNGNAGATSDASVEGMTIPRNAGGGILVVNSSPLLTNLQIRYNAAVNGAGIFLSNSSSSISNIEIANNRAGNNGSAIYTSQSNVVLTNSIFHDNRADGTGSVLLSNSSDVFTNVTIYYNNGEFGGGVYVSGGSPRIRNTIIFRNDSSIGIQVEVVDGGTPSFANCLVLGSGGSGSWNSGFGQDLGGNIDADPVMHRFASTTFGLHPGSPCINKGNNVFFQPGQTPDLSGFTTDQRGTPRIMNGTVDIGAAESVFGILSSNLTPNDDEILFVKKGGSGTKDGSSWENAAPELADALFAANLNDRIYEIWVAGGTYHPLYRPDNFSNADPKSPYNSFLLVPSASIYGGFKGDETELADRDLGLTENASILSGDFNGNDNFNFTDLYNNGIKNEFSENAHHVVYGFGSNELNGFTIEGGNNTSSIPGETLLIDETIVPTEYGSGILAHSGSGIFENLVIRNNLGNKGAGFTAYESSESITNSVIYHNYNKGSGAGIMIAYPDVLVINNTNVLQNQSATGPGGAGISSTGSGLFLIGSSIITNNILRDNEDSPHANLYSDGSSEAHLGNNIIAGSGGSVSWQFDDFDDEGGNMDLDPQFVDINAGNFALTECSRAIDAGGTQFFPPWHAVPVTDIVSNSRIINSRIDIGAFEFQSVRSPEATALAGNAKASSYTFEDNAAHTFTAEADVCDSDLLTLVPTNLSGMVTAKVWVDAQVNSYAGAVYLQRHYDIAPDENAPSATGRVVLYFTQAEFDALNSKLLTDSEYLPTGQPDGESGRKANLRIYQFHGPSSGGTGSPASYGSSRTVIDPDDQDIQWNAALSRWEVSFSVEGFSGFFAGTVTQNPLPVRLVSFEGKQTDDQKIKLDWKVAEQEGIDVYEVEYSANGKTFTKIGQTYANSLASTDYHFTDTLTHSGDLAYYRLKINELDGKTAYSRIITVRLSDINQMVAYPVPAKNELWVDWKKSDAASAEIIDSNGRILKTVRKSSASQKVDISALPTGIFFLKTSGNTVLKVLKE